MSVTNEQRGEIRQLLNRRIDAAQEQIKNNHSDEMAVIKAAAESHEDVIGFRQNLAEYLRLVEIENAAEAARENFQRKIATQFSVGHSSYVTTDWFKTKVKKRTDELETDGLVGTSVGEELQELVRLRGQLGDLITLATTQKELRSLVEKLTDQLGIAISPIERTVLTQ